ncbi:MAG: hypothetical protein KIS91_01130 [Anaerolineae bacterium]|nr:hypothetical protein [Anaerolineae bacterium]
MKTAITAGGRDIALRIQESALLVIESQCDLDIGRRVGVAHEDLGPQGHDVVDTFAK